MPQAQCRLAIDPEWVGIRIQMIERHRPMRRRKSAGHTAPRIGVLRLGAGGDDHKQDQCEKQNSFHEFPFEYGYLVIAIRMPTTAAAAAIRKNFLERPSCFSRFAILASCSALSLTKASFATLSAAITFSSSAARSDSSAESS